MIPLRYRFAKAIGPFPSSTKKKKKKKNIYYYLEKNTIEN